MGYVAHNMIVIVSCFDKEIEAAHDEASRIFPWVSPLSPAVVNGYRSFFVPPDGSKEGWEESDTGDSRRARFKAWLVERMCSDGSSFCDWAEVRIGEEHSDVGIVDYSHPRPGTELHEEWIEHRPEWAKVLDSEQASEPEEREARSA